MSTFMANNATVERKWYIVDAAGKSLGRLAADITVLLTGKHKVDYTPHCDCGDHVIVINAEKVKLTGDKWNQKVYYTHSGYAGGLKEVKYSTLLVKKPELIVKLAVKGMVPKNTLGEHALKRLRVYKGTEHGHEAQQPIAYNK